MDPIPNLVWVSAMASSSPLGWFVFLPLVTHYVHSLISTQLISKGDALQNLALPLCGPPPQAPFCELSLPCFPWLLLYLLCSRRHRFCLGSTHVPCPGNPSKTRSPSGTGLTSLFSFCDGLPDYVMLCSVFWLFLALEKEMATHSSVLAWRIPGTWSLVGFCLWGCTELDMTEST